MAVAIRRHLSSGSQAPTRLHNDGKEIFNYIDPMFQLPDVKFVHLYPLPINIRWGEAKLIELCRTEMGIDPKRGRVFLFFNRKKDQTKLFFLDDSGSQELKSSLRAASWYQRPRKVRNS